MKKELDLSVISPKKIQKVLIKIGEMADVFLKSAEHEKNTVLTLGPPSSYIEPKNVDQGVKS